MAREATGEVRERGGLLEARITLEGRRRKEFKLLTCKTRGEALERARVLSGMVRRFRRAGVLDTPDARRLLDMAASAPARTVEGVLRVAEELAGDELTDATVSTVSTFKELAKRWTDGELHTLHPDHVKEKDTSLDKARIAKLCEIDLGGITLGDVRLDFFTLDHADAVMRSLPKEARRPATRRAYAQIIHRVLALAVYPCREIKVSPIPRGWLPKAGKAPAYPYLYPDEDAQLLAALAVPLPVRLLIGFLAREGCRRGEAAAFTWKDFDLERGAVSLDENKTDDARAWVLDPGVARALQAYRKRYRADAADMEPVFADESGASLDVEHLAAGLRRALMLANVTRPELHEGGMNRGRLRAHDLRATFITLALANGRTETWVQDRTGHTTSGMINRYRRQARQARELDMRWLDPLDQVIPELRPRDATGPAVEAPTGDEFPPIAPNAASMGSDAQPTNDPKRVSFSEFVHEERLELSRLAAPEPKGEHARKNTGGSRDSRGNSDEEERADRPVGAIGGNQDPPGDPVELALAEALTRASMAGQWSTVEVLSRELTARREARAHVVNISASRTTRRGGR